MFIRGGKGGARLKVNGHHSFLPTYLVWLLCILSCYTLFLGDESATGKCRYGECKKFNGRKKEIRKKVIKKLQNPSFIDIQEPIKNKLEDIQKFEKKEPSQLFMDKINSVFFSIQSLKHRKGIKKMLPIPETSATVFTTLTPFNKRNAQGYEELISIVKFQKVKYEVRKYLMKTKYSIDEFWHLVKRLLIDDNDVFEILKLNNRALCNVGSNVSNNQILELSEQINYSPLLYSGNTQASGWKYHIDSSIRPMDCKYLKSHSISKKNSICVNLTLLDLYGYCHPLKIVKKINTCLHSFRNFTTNNCKGFTKTLSKLNRFNKSYIGLANYILTQQILPAYFSVKLAPKLESKVSNYKILYHLLYNDILQEWTRKVVNAKKTLSLIKNEYSKKSGKYQCHNKIVVLDYFNKITDSINTYENLMSKIDKVKSTNISLYLNKLPIWFPKVISIITLPIRWKIGLSNIIKENIDHGNAECIFKMLNSVLNELHNSSEGYISIRLDDLTYNMEPIYKVYATLINIYEDDFSLKNLLSKNNSYAKLQEFITFDYKLSLMYIYYNIKKCSKAVNSFDKFLEELNYSKNNIAILQCLIKNKGNIKNCNVSGIFDIIINLLSKINTPDFNIANLENVVIKIAKHSGNNKISDIIDEYRVCCQGKCSVPEYCNNNKVKEFCAECLNSQKIEGCNSIYNTDIQNTIKECCFRGEIQQINDISQQEKYDPCKLGYRYIENEYKWEYPELRCSLGTSEQKKCYSLLINNMSNLQTILQYLLKNSDGKFDSGKTFCSNPKEKLDNLCCNSIRMCGICENFDEKLCLTNVLDLINLRQSYWKNLEDISNKTFLEFLKNKIDTYGKNGFAEFSTCNSEK